MKAKKLEEAPKKDKPVVKKEISLKATVFDVSGNEVESVTLPKDIFMVDVSPQLIAQYVRVYLSNQRMARGTAKTRSEVAGSTRKIYRQKGTGRARHGDRKAPLFVGGGAAHGPKGANYDMKINKKQKKKALLGVLSTRFKNNDIIFVKGLHNIEAKTKIMQTTIHNLKITDKKILLATIAHADLGKLKLAARNIPNLTVREAVSVNTYDILKPKKLIFMIEALEAFTKHHAN